MMLARQVIAGARELKNIRLSYIRKAFSLMARREKIGVGVLALVALLNAGYAGHAFYLAHTHEAPASGGEYHEGLLGQPRLINPLTAMSNTDLALTHLIYSGLFNYATDGTLIPDLAESLPVISEDQKQYTIKLKHNVKWHNNQTFNADDVVFTIHALQDPAYKSPLRSEWLNTSVDKTDDYTVVFTNKDIAGPFIHNLTLPIIAKSVWSGVDPANFFQSNASLAAVGTGPYAIKEIRKLPSGKVQGITLEAFPYYYNGMPNINLVQMSFYDSPDDVINALHSGEIQGFGFVPFDRSVHIDSQNDALLVQELPQPQYQALFFNLRNKLFADKNVRTALSLGTDRGQIIQEVYNGSARLASGPILPEQLGFNPAVAVPDYDLEAAQTLLDKAGWTVNAATKIRSKSGQQFLITIATNDFVLNSRTAELIQKQWEKLNIKVQLNILPTKELSDNTIRPRNFDALLFSQRLGADPDPFVFWHSSQVKNPGLNVSGFNNAEADKLISGGRSTTHRDIREKDYRRFEEIIADQVPALFLSQSVYIYATETNIKNTTIKILYDPAFRFEDITHWYIDTQRAWGAQ